VGVLVAAAFTLRAIQQGFFGSWPARPAGAPDPAKAHPLAPITLPEKLGALLLVGASVVVGLRPDLLLDWINPALQSPLLQSVIRGGAP
jgi:NADH-quinone oxidoreductase subunit M